MTALSSLARYAKSVEVRRRRAVEGDCCELCGAPIQEDSHKHVIDRKTTRRLLCVCSACGLGFLGAKTGRFRTVPDRSRVRECPAPSLEYLHSLGIPVGLSFLYQAPTPDRVVAIFPGPAGATASDLPIERWHGLVRTEVEEEVEGALIRCTRSGESQMLITGIDVCYELTALLRKVWRGIDGGESAHHTLATFFKALIP